MGIAGQQPKPTALKILEGRPGHRPLPPDEPMPEGDLSACPEDFSPEERVLWEESIENAPRGLLRKLDRELFIVWCVATAQRRRAEIAMQREGDVVWSGGETTTIEKKNGDKVTKVIPPSQNVSPWLRIIDSAAQRQLRATSELGFSPTSRTRISVGGSSSAKAANKFSSNTNQKRA